MRFNAKELRDVSEEEVKEKLKKIQRRPIYFILENIYDTYNVGGLFRLADAIGVSKMYLCGEMEIPPNGRIKKASIGTYKVVSWEYKKTAKEAIKEIKQTHNLEHGTKKEKGSTFHVPRSNVKIVAVEQSSRSIPYTKVNYSLPLALIVGNETSGVTQETLQLCDKIAEIPMWGVNKSLNVIVSAAIVSYYAVSNIT